MERVVYPAVFDSSLMLNQVQVTFPDIPGVKVIGLGAGDAIDRAAEAAAKALMNLGTLPVPSGPGEIELEPGQYVNIITIDVDKYRNTLTATKSPAKKKAATKKPTATKSATKKATTRKKSTSAMAKPNTTSAKAPAKKTAAKANAAKKATTKRAATKKTESK
ncbi:hypothetical protein [uncultured Secundilactobacillus sp.]|uniref:hypothetical protein n=1 Tax=uncultured Secundilactobacillus sp. TaxID=2813935 RepID=UPI002589515C|nr:hypothetical protein [uncultured Secundilactobacillus sp.]